MSAGSSVINVPSGGVLIGREAVRMCVCGGCIEEICAPSSQFCSKPETVLKKKKKVLIKKKGKVVPPCPVGRELG